MELTKDTLLKLQNDVTSLIKEHAQGLLKVWKDEKNVDYKARKEPVTEFDRKTEELLRRDLSLILPQAGFIVEEGENKEEKELNWIIDPIDQTKNFIAEIPLFYIQVALLKNGEPMLGVIYNPVSDQMFGASEGNGVRNNDRLVPKADERSLKESIIDVDFGGGEDGDVDWKIVSLSKIIRSCYRVRLTSGAYSPFVVTKGIDGFVTLSKGAKIVDLMPRIILAKEMGMRSESVDIDVHKVMITASSSVFEEISTLLQS